MRFFSTGSIVLALAAVSWVRTAREEFRFRIDAPAALPRTPPAQRVASVTFVADEILLELAEPERIILLTSLSDSPEYCRLSDRAKRVPHRIRRSRDVEAILAHRPDLIFVSDANTADAVFLMSRAGLPAVILRHPTCVEDVRRNIRVIAAAVDADPRPLIARIDRAIAAVPVSSRSPRVLNLDTGNVTYGRGTLLHDVIAKAGGVNVADGSGTYVLSEEEILRLDPEVILCIGAARPRFPGRARVRTLAPRAAYSSSQFTAETIERVAAALAEERP